MRKMLLAGAALAPLLLAAPASAAIIVSDLGLDPNLSVARNAVNGTFEDQYTFTLDQAATITIVGITNTYAGGVGAGRFIANFTGTIFSDGLDGLPGTLDDGSSTNTGKKPCGAITIPGFAGCVRLPTLSISTPGTGESAQANYGADHHHRRQPEPLRGA